MNYEVIFSKQAHKDIKKLTPGLRDKAKDIIRNRISIDPHSGKPLFGNLKGYYSVRLTYKDRIVYSIDEDQVIVFILRAKTHYGE
ncbi:MAG: type II toxin-antitoxin system mRNA interferase toxin, RelE/StbE family [Thermodesulfobacteriota bacterium]|nr:type II toxin-antitoxin system mRNA interferase toxin, RelE/StbE family [Thermodesulfobacteriota bacterium]